MPTPVAYSYAIVRVVPWVERGECINVGVVVLCRARRFLAARIVVDPLRLAAFAPGVDFMDAISQLATIPRLCAGDSGAGPIAQLSIAERFDWLVAPRSAMIQTSPVHAGLCVDPLLVLDRLLVQLVRIPPTNTA